MITIIGWILILYGCFYLKYGLDRSKELYGKYNRSFDIEINGWPIRVYYQYTEGYVAQDYWDDDLMTYRIIDEEEGEMLDEYNELSTTYANDVDKEINKRLKQNEKK